MLLCGWVLVVLCITIVGADTNAHANKLFEFNSQITTNANTQANSQVGSNVPNLIALFNSTVYAKYWMDQVRVLNTQNGQQVSGFQIDIQPPITGGRTFTAWVPGVESFCYSSDEKGAYVYVTSLQTNQTRSIKLPCAIAGACNTILGLDAYAYTLYGFAGYLNNNYTTANLYFFSIDLRTDEVAADYYYTTPYPYVFYYSSPFGVKVENNTATLFFLLYLNEINGMTGHFSQCNLQYKTVITEVGNSSTCGILHFTYNYNDGYIYCPASDGLGKFSPRDTTATFEWVLQLSYGGRWDIPIVDLENSKFYLQVGTHEMFLICDLTVAPTVKCDSFDADPSFWYPRLMTPPPPCISGCVNGYCNNITNTCVCNSGWTGTACDQEKSPATNTIQTIDITTASLVIGFPIALALMKVFFSLKNVHISFKTILVNIQLLLLPIQSNSVLYDKTAHLFSYMGLLTLTPPFALDLADPKQVYLTYGNYFFPKLLGVVILFVLCWVLSRPTKQVHGIRLFGNSLFFERDLCGKIILFSLIPLIFSLCSVALNISTAVNGIAFGTCYILWNAILLSFVLYVTDFSWFSPTAIKYTEFSPNKKRSSIAFGRKKATTKTEEQLPKFGFHVSEKSAKYLCCHPLGLKKTSTFMENYASVFSEYIIIKADGNSSLLDRIRSKLCHKFELISVIHSFVYTVLTVLLWPVEAGVIVLAVQQFIFFIILVILRPYHTYKSFAVAVLSSGLLVVQLVLLSIFVYNTNYDYLIAVAILALLSAVLNFIIIPIIFATFILEETDEENFEKIENDKIPSEKSPLIANHATIQEKA